MKIFPAIDLFDGKAVRLLRGRYEDMTIYSEDPPSIGRDFAAAGLICKLVIRIIMSIDMKKTEILMTMHGFL